jgi:hypothetical protein
VVRVAGRRSLIVVSRAEFRACPAMMIPAAGASQALEPGLG